MKSNTIIIPDPREGFSMQVAGPVLNRHDLHEIAAELKIQTKDVLLENNTLTIFNTSKESQEIVNDNALATFVAMALSISPEDITEITPVKAKPKVLDRNDFLDEEEED